MRKRDVDSAIRVAALAYAKENDYEDSTLDEAINELMWNERHNHIEGIEPSEATCSLMELNGVNPKTNPKLFTALAINELKNGNGDAKPAMFFNYNTNSKALIAQLVALGWKHCWTYKGQGAALVQGFFMAPKY